MLLPSFINFDMRPFTRNWNGRLLKTDVFGTVEEITAILPADYFTEILYVHVIEHFPRDESVEILGKLKTLLRKGGLMIVEGPCILGHYWYHLEHPQGKGIQGLIEGLYPHDNIKKYGPEMQHRSGWTGPLVADALTNLGFRVAHVGPGQTHGYGKRDFRVEAFK